MIRWLLVLMLALLLVQGLLPWLSRLGLGRLPGDFRWRMWGRDWHLPLSSTLLLSLVAWLLAHWVGRI